MPKPPQQPVLITGCSSGIGYAVAKELQARGYLVVASARQHKDVEQLQSEGLHSVLIDYTDSKSIQAGLQHTLELTDGKLFALINNGAYGQTGAVEDLPSDALREQFETNVFGWHELTNLIIPIMREQQYGRIVQISSVLGFVALKYRGAYVASKFALEGLTDALRLELSGTGIQVSLVEPGPIESKFRENCIPHFERFIDMKSSYHREQYEQLAKRRAQPDPTSRFTLPAKAVVKKVVRALESPTAKTRYYVTFPTYLFGFLKRLLSGRMLDRLLGNVP